MARKCFKVVRGSAIRDGRLMLCSVQYPYNIRYKAVFRLIETVQNFISMHIKTINLKSSSDLPSSVRMCSGRALMTVVRIYCALWRTPMATTGWMTRVGLIVKIAANINVDITTITKKCFHFVSLGFESFRLDIAPVLFSFLLMYLLISKD